MQKIIDLKNKKELIEAFLRRIKYFINRSIIIIRTISIYIQYNIKQLIYYYYFI